MSKNKESQYVRWYLNKEQEPNIRFINWISKVEYKIKQEFGYELLDLPDEDYMLYFESSYSPNMMVKIIYKSNGL
jgi:hypothetical protein